MNDTTQAQISHLISQLADGDVRISELMAYSVGRVCLKLDRQDSNWRDHLADVDTGHIVDWLRAAIINEEAWLSDVDSKNRPKKLMKFGNLKDIAREADKAMFKGIQRNGNVTLIDGDEELFMDLDNGYRLIKLLTPAALDREGAEMQHCIGGGGYDILLNDGSFTFLSLRDKYNNAHATLQLKSNELWQFHGKQNKPPHRIYTDAVKPYFTKHKVSIGLLSGMMGYVISKEGVAYNITELPEDLCVVGDTRLSHPNLLLTLPDGLSVEGDLTITDTRLTGLPNRMRVTGNLSLWSSTITTIPSDLEVGGDIILNESNLKKLPAGLNISHGLAIANTPIASLPAKLRVGGALDLGSTSIKELPSDLVFGGNINLCDTPITALADNMTFPGSLYLAYSAIETLPAGLTVLGDLSISHTRIKCLPEDLDVRGRLSIDSTEIDTIPNTINIGKGLILSNTKVRTLPEGLRVGGYIKIAETAIKTIPFSIKGSVEIWTSDEKYFARELRDGHDLEFSPGRKIHAR